MEKQNALRSFIDNTGLEPDLAAQILSEVNWDVGRGIQRFQDHVRTGRIKSVYPPPQVSAGWAGPAHRPPGEGPPGYSRLPGNPLCPQWSDPYGEVRNPPVERIIPIERVPNKGMS
uniref:UBA domain-containing protein n=1 Tax=Magallana gigas TaxID=29159 RepID=K1PM73_MAGGI